MLSWAPTCVVQIEGDAASVPLKSLRHSRSPTSDRLYTIPVSSAGSGVPFESTPTPKMIRWAAADVSQGAYGAPVAILRAKSHPSSEAAYASSPKLPSARIDGSPTTGAEVQGVLTGNPVHANVPFRVYTDCQSPAFRNSC